MNISTSLAADLALLTAALFDVAVNPGTDVAATLQRFTTNTRMAVESFLGLSVTITTRTHAVADQVILHLTLLDDHPGPGDIKTSLLLPGPTNTTDDQPSIQVVLYATTPGAFVDLAADLAFLTGNDLDSADLDQHRMLAHEPDITGVLQDESVIDEAIGVLIARGHTREQAHTELQALAAAHHTDPVTEATRIMSALTPGGPGLSVA